MVDYFLSLNPVCQAFVAGLFTWGCTVVGSAFVYFFKHVDRKLLDILMGAAAGVMIAASFWSLLNPALDYAEADYGKWAWVPVAVGFIAGGYCLRLIDKFVPHLHLNMPVEEAEGLPAYKQKLSKSTLLFLAITIHNFPEGLAIGVTFGALASQTADMGLSLMGAVSLAVGIGLQNIPEGAALSLPIRAEGNSRGKAFWYGSMSAVVEPIGAVLGAAFVMSMSSVLPYALAFAAGAMIFVVVEELIPESQGNGYGDSATMGLMLGFVVMMVLDVALG
ncbi:ZIP family metal transporter [Exercitatus varius]|uniref:ZIP family metal transporter n=1 Tax=Exercitatus varius TaxID=67857 RepID=UPI00294B1424|nr:ZIP family metal transporter [Exercitatus varius]MDG2962368.1 ZIP family metal transporter [Exercitatus varius]